MITGVALPPVEPPTPAEHRGAEDACRRSSGAVKFAPYAREAHYVVVSRTTSTPSSYDQYLAPLPNGGVRVVLVSSPAVQKTVSDSEARTAASMLHELRRLTGWGWDRLATALGKSRQALHGWTLGRDIVPANLERIAKLRAAVAYVDRGLAEENLKALNAPTSDGRIAADYLDEGRFDEFMALLGRGAGRPDMSGWARSPEQRREGRKHWVDEIADSDGEEAVVRVKKGETRRVSLRRRA
jgi:hypothetical protein